MTEALSEKTSSALPGRGARYLRKSAWALSLLQKYLRSSETAQILICGVAGAFIGVMIAGLHKGVDFLHRVNFGLPAGASLSTGDHVDLLRILFIPAAGGLALGLGALVARRFGAREVVDPIEANALHGGRMSLPASLRLVVTTLVSNASGAAVGMEAGYSQLGASVFSSLGERFSLRRADQRIFVGAGAAAAIAAAFNAPLAGAFYGFELIIGTYMTRALAPVAVAALASVLAARAVSNPEPLFVVHQAFYFKQSVYLLFALLGVFAAGFSVLAMKSVTWVERGLRHIPLPQWLRPAMGGIALTQLAIFLPQVLGSGHGAIQYLFDHDWPLATLLVILAAKLAASSLSVGSGFRGGMFSSSLFLGCLFGAAFADIAAILVPRLGEHHAALMMVGMGSVAAGVIGAPLTIVFLVLEGTGDFPMTIAVMVGVIISSSLVRLNFGYSFSTWRFHQRGLGIQSPHDIGWIADLTVAKLMRSDATVAEAGASLEQLREKYPLGSSKRLFVEDAGQFIGSMDVAALHDKQRSKDIASPTARDVAAGPGAFLLPGQNVRTALMLFDNTKMETLPVLRSAVDRQIIGFLTEAYALRRYNQELERRRDADMGTRNLFPIAEPPSAADRKPTN
jgi:CIC family chloride channel protein